MSLTWEIRNSFYDDSIYKTSDIWHLIKLLSQLCQSHHKTKEVHYSQEKKSYSHPIVPILYYEAYSYTDVYALIYFHFHFCF